jgi:hypothetical protein
MEITSRIIAAAEDAADMRRKMGAAALDMDTASGGSGQTRWRATVAARLPSQQWPQRTVLITAVDAHTGEPVVFDRHSGVDLADAVAASTSNGLRPARTGKIAGPDSGAPGVRGVEKKACPRLVIRSCARSAKRSGLDAATYELSRRATG